jgi:hypothetical protein
LGADSLWQNGFGALIGVPFVQLDIEVVGNLIKMANGNVELAQCRVGFIDEIGNMTSAENTSGDISCLGVMNGRSYDSVQKEKRNGPNCSQGPPGESGINRCH